MKDETKSSDVESPDSEQTRCSSHCYAGIVHLSKHMSEASLVELKDTSEDQSGDLHEPTLLAWLHYVCGIRDYSRDRFPKLQIEVTILKNDAE